MNYQNTKPWRKLLPLILFLVSVIGFQSCYTDYGLTADDYDIVVTTYNKSVNFQQYKTYALVDSVFHITGDTTKPDSEILSRNNDALILSTIKNNMNRLGYTELENPSEDNLPDVALVVAALGTQVDTYYYYGYPWYGYGGGWWGYPGYGWGYPVGGVGTSTYYVGTLFINYFPAAELEGATGPRDVELDWTATINGLLSGTNRRIEDRIDQAFDQSPYLKLNN
ncbi:MAG: DUF4136 domain-containing protein [Melioribacteraceae bacterium]|nr:DUF4136 domain-containing protein [Melioribacteraceae bacterium]